MTITDQLESYKNLSWQQQLGNLASTLNAIACCRWRDCCSLKANRDAKRHYHPMNKGLQSKFKLNCLHSSLNIYKIS
jgi:hypothetical protein